MTSCFWIRITCTENRVFAIPEPKGVFLRYSGALSETEFFTTKSKQLYRKNASCSSYEIGPIPERCKTQKDELSRIEVFIQALQRGFWRRA